MPDSPAFYNKITLRTREGAMDVLRLNFSEAFNTVSHNILIPKSGCYSLDNKVGRKNGWMFGLSITVDGLECTWSGVSQGPGLRPGLPSFPRTWRQQEGALAAGLWLTPRWEAQSTHSGQGCHPEGPRQAGQGPDEIQQGEGQRPALPRKKPLQ